MNSLSCKTFTAQVTIGMTKGYSKEKIMMNDLKDELLNGQREIKEKYNVLLSVKIRQCEIVFLGQEELSVELEFIQYPKFLQGEKELKKAIISLTEILMLKLEQNRVVIVFKDDTIMLEQNENINPDIKI